MSKKMPKILIADDHPLFKEALTYIVESSFANLNKQTIELLHTADLDSTLKILNENSINWLFLDLNMPGSNGLSGLSTIRKLHPNLPIIVISANESEEIIQSSLACDIAGYITKSTQPDDIEKAIISILEGNHYSPEIEPGNLKDKESEGINNLTTAQFNILIHIGIGKLNKQIAQDLKITEATVKAHITQIYKKLNVSNRTQAALIAKQANLVG